MKIKLPNPNDFINDVMGFLDQMELCVHHARKSAEKILSGYSQEDIQEGNETPYVTFNSPVLAGDEFEKFDSDGVWRQDLEIEIVEL
jgi:hypothetical protein